MTTERSVTPLPDRPRSDFLVGAAIGTGLAARSAIRGGADFLLALSAGRIRAMGEPSIATMLPLHESNDYVFSFAEREILPKSPIPVFFGACAFDPRQDLEALVGRIAAAGFSGIANFPTAILIDGGFRRLVERVGVGFERELGLLAIARRHGLTTLAYTHTAEEGRRAAACGVDIVNIDLGWNMGGVSGVDTDLRVDEAALRAQSIARAIRAVSPRTRCVVEGGPIVGPKQLEEVCRIASIDGYIGGSTIDRVPLENAVEVVTSAFKAIGALRNRIDGLERQLEGRSYPLALHGHSPGVRDARTIYARLARSEHPVLIVGEPGTGRREVAQALHGAGPRGLREAATVACAGGSAGELRVDLFGVVAGADPLIRKNRLGWIEVMRGSSLVLEDVDRVDRQTQLLLLDAIESGRYCRLGSREASAFDTRLICLTGAAPARGARDPDHDPRFLAAIGRFRIELPPLRDRLEDLPLLVEATLSRLAARDGRPCKEIDPTAFRRLETHDWPGNLRELRSVLDSASLAAPGRVIEAHHIPPLARGPRDGAGDRSLFRSEIEWIMDGLRRNRFRRGRTADYLGISRKTLYNKMRRLGLLGDGG